MSGSSSSVRFKDEGQHVLLSNGFVELKISKPAGIVTGIKYGGIDNLLEVKNKETNRGYWDLNWSLPDGPDKFDVVSGTSFQIVTNSEEIVEVSFYRAYVSSMAMLPLNIDKRFVLLSGCSGFYTYAIYHRPSGWEDFNLNQTRIVFKLREDKFNFMAISDTKQRYMPYPEDRLPQNCEQLAYKEAVILLNPKNPDLKGEVDDKYQYSCENRSNKLHGWISMNPLVGFWMITPSYEFKNGGPLKQNLQSHTGPTCLSVFHSAHYGGLPLCARFRDGEAWSKVFGPVFVYLNSAASEEDHSYLWQDAKRQMQAEVNAWPYSWPASPSFALPLERASVSGTLIVEDSYISSNPFPAAFAWVGLALPGEQGSWQEESKGYQFWTQADDYGNFKISNIVAGTYDLYGWVPGLIGDYKNGSSITIAQGASIQLGFLVYKPPRSGPTIWQIGTPERSASGFYIPDADSKFINKLFVNQEKFRQYGLWNRYAEIYTSKDLVFTVGVNDCTKDWFFVHGCRSKSDGSFEPTTWEIRFSLKSVAKSGTYTLQIAIASSHYAAIRVGVNSYSTIFSTHTYGRDNSIARHGVHGLYSLHSVEISSELLQAGNNSIYLTQKNAGSSFNGIMYDCIRLEAPGSQVKCQAGPSGNPAHMPY